MLICIRFWEQETYADRCLRNDLPETERNIVCIVCRWERFSELLGIASVEACATAERIQNGPQEI